MSKRDELKKILARSKLMPEKERLLAEIDKTTKELLELGDLLDAVDQALEALDTPGTSSIEEKNLRPDGFGRGDPDNYISTAGAMAADIGKQQLPDVGDNSEIWARMERARMAADAREKSKK